MTIEETLFTALGALVENRVYPEVAPKGVARPYIVYQMIPTGAINFLDQSTIPSKKLRRYQVSIWGDVSAQVKALAITVEDTLRAAAVLQTTVENSPGSTYEPDTLLYGSNQDFSFVA